MRSIASSDDHTFCVAVGDEIVWTECAIFPLAHNGHSNVVYTCLSSQECGCARNRPQVILRTITIDIESKSPVNAMIILFRASNLAF
mmetsp:Transcript_27343/g.43992  ORF Transcript_27343/g.43992 Transcript_27343/m.43992 type:complete len:87 (+) Transcript_27343:278-538(+)